MNDRLLRLKSSIKAFFCPRPLELNRQLSFYSIFGLPLLYGAAYYLPPVSSVGAYFLVSRNLGELIILPTVITVLVGSTLIWTVCTAVSRWASPRLLTLCAMFAVALLIPVALKCLFYAAGSDWRKLVPGGDTALAAIRYAKYLAFAISIVFVFLVPQAILKLNRMLGSLGFAFAALAAVQLLMIWGGDRSLAGASSATQISAEPSIGKAGSRRVVWVIFDETDFDRTFGAQRDVRFNLENLDWLAGRSVFATNAHAPASGTLYSLPALLTGMPLTGQGVVIDRRGILSQDISGRKAVPFDQASSLFGRLAEQGLSASVLGFYHPYCKLFTLAQCDSFPLSEVAGIDAALWANVPDAFAPSIKNSNIWESITQKSLVLLPRYLDRDDSLTLIHLNIPHPPSDYANRFLHLPLTSDPLTEYAKNLALTDEILGRITHEMQKQLSRHELLLIVSTDHWLRNMWYQPMQPEISRLIPFMVWKVGETQRITISAPFNTVRSAAMVLEYLNGRLTTQAEIAEWLQRQPDSPSFIAPAS